MPSPTNHCLSVRELIAYGDGGLSTHRVEHLNACVLCRAALDGLELSDQSTQQSLLDGTFMEDLDGVSLTQASTAKQRTLSPARWLVAASLLLALGWASWQYYYASEGSPSYETSPLAYVEQPYRRQMRSAGITTDMYGAAAQAFAVDSFIRSIELYKLAIPKAPTELLRTRGFYEIGIAHWKTGDFELAIDNLTRARLGELDYYEDSTWALAQLYRQTGYLNEALSLYRDLLTIDRSPYLPKARQMIEVIEDSDANKED
jgi:tetratricopeptide (TPR) repeat protein